MESMKNLCKMYVKCLPAMRSNAARAFFGRIPSQETNDIITADGVAFAVFNDAPGADYFKREQSTAICYWIVIDKKTANC